MYRHYHHKLKRNVVIIHPGEYLSTRENVVISTILGSCIAVAIHDPVERIGGMNHFMLPGEYNSRGYFSGENARYGMYAMEILINELLKLGANRSRIRAKVFGGGHVLHRSTSSHIPDSNIAFALEYLETEAIPVENSDVGGSQARKLFYFPQEFRVLVKRFGGAETVKLETEEESYLEKLRKQKTTTQDSSVTFF